MTVYTPTSQKELSLRKQRAYSEFAKVVNWGRGNPVKFAELMFGMKLMDYQVYSFMESWNKPFVAWLMCRAGGKTVIVACYLMTKMVLIPNYKVYIATTKLEQAIESFTKIEDLACNRVPSFKGLTDVFKYELDTTANKNGFGHNPAGYKLALYNGSALQTLSSNIAGARGKRGGIWYDEAAFIEKAMMDMGDNYANVDADFSTDSTGDLYIQPRQMPLQLLYTSSAGSRDMPFYDKYKTYARHMIAGNPDYFVCDFDVDAVFNHSSIDGKPIKSHLSTAKIEAQIRDNPEAAQQELYNLFLSGAGENAVVSMDCIIRNSQTKLPVFFNDTDQRKFILCYDPARNFDNSILSIFEVLKLDNGYNLDLVNVISMVNRNTDKKTPLNYVEQLKIIRKAMIDYNGYGAAEWENIELYIDAGAGGAPRSGIADQLLFPWTDEKGIEHRGVIDPDDPQYEDDRRNHPENARIVHLLEPRSYKAKMYGALEELSDLNLIHYTLYDGYKDYLLLPGEDGYDEHRLSKQEREALQQIELAKNELSYMVRSQTSGTSAVTYELMKERKNTMHDDRAYTLAMGAYALWLMRTKDLRKKRVSTAPDTFFMARPPSYNFVSPARRR